MNRREFLTLAVKAAAVSAMPTTVFSIEDNHYPDFDETATYGNAMVVSNELTNKEKFRIIEHLEADMRKYIPPSHRDRVTYPDMLFGYSGVADPFNEYGSVAWKYKGK